MVIRWHDAGVTYGGNHFAAFKCIELTWLYTFKLDNIVCQFYLSKVGKNERKNKISQTQKTRRQQEETSSLPDIPIGMIAGTSARGIQHRQDGRVSGRVILDYASETTCLVGHSDDGEVSRWVAEIR